MSLTMDETRDLGFEPPGWVGDRRIGKLSMFDPGSSADRLLRLLARQPCGVYVGATGFTNEIVRNVVDAGWARQSGFGINRAIQLKAGIKRRLAGFTGEFAYEIFDDGNKPPPTTPPPARDAATTPAAGLAAAATRPARRVEASTGRGPGRPRSTGAAVTELSTSDPTLMDSIKIRGVLGPLKLAGGELPIRMSMVRAMIGDLATAATAASVLGQLEERGLIVRTGTSGHQRTMRLTAQGERWLDDDEGDLDAAVTDSGSRDLEIATLRRQLGVAEEIIEALSSERGRLARRALDAEARCEHVSAEARRVLADFRAVSGRLSDLHRLASAPFGAPEGSEVA